MFSIFFISVFRFFFFNDTATTEIYTLSLHDALPICDTAPRRLGCRPRPSEPFVCPRSEEHTSELQSLRHLVCRLLLEKKKKIQLLRIKKKKKKNERTKPDPNDQE